MKALVIVAALVGFIGAQVAEARECVGAMTEEDCRQYRVTRQNLEDSLRHAQRLDSLTRAPYVNNTKDTLIGITSLLGGLAAVAGGVATLPEGLVFVYPGGAFAFGGVMMLMNVGSRMWDRASAVRQIAALEGQLRALDARNGIDVPRTAVTHRASGAGRPSHDAGGARGAGIAR